MRGFVVALDTQPGPDTPPDDALGRRLQAWLQATPQRTGVASSLSRCRILRYSDSPGVPAEFNQRVVQSAEAITLWTGPRVDMTPAALLPVLSSHDSAGQVAAARSAPSALDTAVAISYRPDAHSLLVRTDILAATFIYWVRSGRWLLLSNASLTLAKLVRAGLDPVATSEFLACGSVFDNRSIYGGVRSLPPASIVKFEADRPEPDSACYWSLHALPFASVSGQQACDRVIDVLDQDFQTLNDTGKRFVLDLTGGYDSRTNLGFAVRNLKSFETTVTGTAGSEDVILSQALADRYRLQHTVVAPPVPQDVEQDRHLAEVVALATDLEYDILEYARIHHTQTRFDTLQQPSVHGSGGGDIARNIILRPEFCTGSPDAGLVVDPLIAQRFRSLVPAALARPGLPLADWNGHMRQRIAMHDRPELPAYARLDIIYLRMRMQFWQGRIGSSTNRFRSSFSPWTNRQVLEAMLCTHWKARDHQMLSRRLLGALHPGLSRVGVSRGEPAGPAWADVIRGLPARLRYYQERLAVRMNRGPQVRADVGRFRHLQPHWEAALAPAFTPQGLQQLGAADGPASNPVLLGRLVTLAHAHLHLVTPQG